MIGFFDPLYLLFLIPSLVIGLSASLYMKFWTSQYFKKRPIQGLNGIQVVEKIATKESFPISFQLTDTKLGDNFNPLNRTLTLSKEVATVSSISSIGIAAHELGHVQQYMEKSPLFNIRTQIVPYVNIGSRIGYMMFLVGLIMSFSSLAWLGIIFFSLTTIFTLITLPLEIDASNRAIKLISKHQILAQQEIPGVKKVLIGAALTYVAATVQSLSSLAFFALRAQGISKD